MFRIRYTLALSWLVAMLFVMASVAPSTALAQDDELSAAEMSQIYGMGVAAYFAGDFNEAEAVLTTLAEAETIDPRVYFYRGLARLKQDNSEGATEDFTKGAELDAAEDRPPVNVAKSLMRVQGAPRLQIEKLRAAAKEAAQERRDEAMRQRYNRIRQNESRVLDRSRGGSTDQSGG